jgi:hypothetical protein
MRAALVLLLVPWLGAAAPSSAAAAQKTLTAARAAVSRAVQSTRKSEPTPAELGAASEALAALKKALEGNAELEAKDASYARAARAARKEVVTQGLDLAIGNLNANAQHRGRVLTVENLKVAEAALAALMPALEEARPLGKRDASYASYLAMVDAAVVRHEQGFDEHWGRMLLERRQALTAAMTALSKDAGDAPRTAASDAAGLLAGLLEGTARAEARNAALRTEAANARAELVAAKAALGP